MDTDTLTFDAPAATLAAGGPLAAADALIERLRADRDYHNLFYALLMRKRVELGVSPFPAGPSADLPADAHEPYEDAIRDAARTVGRLYLDRGDISRAWGFFRLINEPGPVKAALESQTLPDDADVYPLVDIAWHQQVLPTKGFDLILDRHGICSAITMVSSADLSPHPDLRTYCAGRLVRTLHDQLSERLRADIASRGRPTTGSVSELLAANDDLFGEDVYHVDVSHLSSVVQLAMHLPPGPELELARDLCEYGRRLAPQFRGDNDPPFDETYADYLVYLNVLAGRDVEAGLAHFHGKVEREFAEGVLYPVEVLINLLVRIDRPKDALAVAKQYLSDVTDERGMSCPGVTELARRVGDFATVAETAKAKGDPVTFLAGLIANHSNHRDAETQRKQG